MTRTQRSEDVLKNFMKYHNEGYSIPEIAKKFKVDISTIYKMLQQIADENGVTREELLKNKPFKKGESSACTAKEKVDAEKLLDDFNKVEEDLKEVIKGIEKILEKGEQ